MNTIIFHIDVNSAFLSWSAVEKLKNGNSIDLRTIPSIIGGDSASRHGIVLAKSIPAKAYDIHTAEPVVAAIRKCPFLTIESPNHVLYQEYSKNMMNLLRNYTSDIEQLSIDECYMDFGPIAKFYESPLIAANIIKEDIKKQFGFTVNIGIAPNKLLAKMASDFQKPDRIHTLFPDEIAAKMWPLPVDELYMVGHSSATRLKNLGIRTIGELAATDPDYLQSEFKSHGQLMWEYANGIASAKINSSEREAKGVGNSVTMCEDASTVADAKKVLLSLSETVSERLRKTNQIAQTITVEIKYSNFTSYSHQSPFYTPTNTTSALYQTACHLFDDLWNGTPIRLLGIRTAKLLDANTPVQISLFDMDYQTTTVKKPSPDRLKKLDAAVDSIRHKFGDEALVRGSFLEPPNEFHSNSSKK